MRFRHRRTRAGAREPADEGCRIGSDIAASSTGTRSRTSHRQAGQAVQSSFLATVHCGRWLAGTGTPRPRPVAVGVPVTPHLAVGGGRVQLPAHRAEALAPTRLNQVVFARGDVAGLVFVPTRGDGGSLAPGKPPTGAPVAVSQWAERLHRSTRRAVAPTPVMARVRPPRPGRAGP